MEEQIFQKAFEQWKNSDGHTPFWDSLASECGYPSGEDMRLVFKRERKKRGLSKNSILPTVKQNSGAKILLLDIESSPIVAFTWGVYDQRINPDAVIQDWHLLSWSAKWLFDTKKMSDVLTSEEAKNHDDRRIVEKIWGLLDDCDVVIAHNGNGFDIKRLNTRFLKHGFQPPSPYKQIDTLLVARSNFDFTSNKLDFINKFLGLRHKTDTGFDLWKRCFNGDEKALAEMLSYNVNDTDILEDLYVLLRPWMKNHPNLALYNEIEEYCCPNCGSIELESNGFYYGGSAKYESLRCSCGAVSRKKQNLLTKEKRKSLLS